MNKEKEFYAVYGTLRLNQGNYNRLLKGNSTFVKTTQLHGFKMFSLGGFPGISKDNYDKKIVVDVFKVNCPETKKRLDYLEGYSEKNPEYSMYIREKVFIDNVPAWIYIWNGAERSPEIKEGDWVKFINNI
jgi:gamma-glutamylcyclotransferase (GGCT)/AIG2-like uncharacterized protein YtfP